MLAVQDFYSVSGLKHNKKDKFMMLWALITLMASPVTGREFCPVFRIYSQRCSYIVAGGNKETGANNSLEKWPVVKRQSRSHLHLGTRSTAHSDSRLWLQSLIHGPSGSPEQYSCRPWFTPFFISATPGQIKTPCPSAPPSPPPSLVFLLQQTRIRCSAGRRMKTPTHPALQGMWDSICARRVRAHT